KSSAWRVFRRRAAATRGTAERLPATYYLAVSRGGSVDDEEARHGNETMARDPGDRHAPRRAARAVRRHRFRRFDRFDRLDGDWRRFHGVDRDERSLRRHVERRDLDQDPELLFRARIAGGVSLSVAH